jgi:polar amino acid transport system substrate-binding protein
MIAGGPLSQAGKDLALAFGMRAALLIVPLIALAGCGLPRDPERTAEKVRQRGEIRVGVSEAAPWIRRVSQTANAEASGVEAELIRELARREGVKVRWRWGTLEEHFAALESGQLDLVAGALSESTPWSKKIGVTRPFVTSRINVGFPPGQAARAELKGVRVAVEPASEWARLAADEGAVVIVAERPFETGLPVVAPEWELRAHGYRLRPEKPLEQTKQVMAVPSGENAWLMTVERHLSSRENEIEEMLVREARR